MRKLAMPFLTTLLAVIFLGIVLGVGVGTCRGVATRIQRQIEGR